MQSQLLYLAGSLGGVAAICGLCVLLFGAGAASLDEGSAQARNSSTQSPQIAATPPRDPAR